MKREIIRIDEEKCNGCGLCVPACAEGALQIIDGKAKLVSEVYCDGLGACLGECPEGALIIEERDAEEFDEQAVHEHLREMYQQEKLSDEEELACGCPSSQEASWKDEETLSSEETAVRASSKLRQWPVQLTLVHPEAEYFKEAELLVAADCVPFSYASFHQDFLKGKSLVVGCPKLDDFEFYLNKLTAILKRGSLKKIQVVNMEVPCCYGLISLVKEALSKAGKNIPLEQVVVSVRGEVLEKNDIPALSRREITST